MLRMTERVTTQNAVETEALGAELARELRPGDVVLILGELGSGKTTFVRGAARALGVRTPVTSPTYTIGQRYPAPVPVAHVDLFRVASLDAEDPGILDDYLSADMITFVEWPEVARGQLDGHVARTVRIQHAGAEQRVVEIA
jgi:tRNA threonylcarbamoyladenosine biosynthesis protein TsaE